MLKIVIVKFTNCILCDKGRLYPGEDLYVDQTNGVIIQKPNDESVIDEVIDLEGLIVAPGFIDIQINGCFGFDFCSKDPPEIYLENYHLAMKSLIQTGVTSICPTLPSSYSDTYKVALPILKPSRNCDMTDSLGVHCEGPFISTAKKGCHPIGALTEARNEMKDLAKLYNADGLSKNIRIITAAPEIGGVSSAISNIVKDHKIVFAIGHTNADYETGLKAVRQGATMLTHLYNAMTQVHQRKPGIIGLISSPELARENKLPYFGLIADGVHVHPATVRSAYKICSEKLILVTDAMYLIGAENGSYLWGSNNQYIVKEGNHLFLKGTETIAGSATTLAQCLRNIMQWCQLDLAEAVQFVTNHPAVATSVQDKKGFLNLGCDADLTILDKDGFVKQVYKLGKKISDNSDSYTFS
ncbi:hypothetical protein PACTADRAFT_36945 [Pachysolen tannophilus NRRL Y-2460]|uniref:N-acetylglucosamine-6-phosphate deacetylase n=1 Tax=Pachysolen tannophilus NRRL Y-2460 TaxID=669874 RepID=A0A1E4U0M8_PACTA|nr:hypothetical protein PACTADRAFT_36945 [Pachysolen tannophilus NRRL Y-2460]